MKNELLKAFTGVTPRVILVLGLAASATSIFGFLGILTRSSLQGFVVGAVASTIGLAVALTTAEAARRIRTRRTVFVSYTHHDADFVMQLTGDLLTMHVVPLVDRFELKVGDDIRKAVDEMIDRSEYFLFVVSEEGMKSDWSKKELEQALSRNKRLLPVVLNPQSVPAELSGLFYADFSGDYEDGLIQLRKTFSSR